MARLRFPVTGLIRHSTSWLDSLAIGVLSALAAMLVRQLLDGLVPGGAPFALLFPATTIATLFGRWVGGVVCGAITIPVVWYFTYPVAGSFEFADDAGRLTIVSVTVACAITILIADLFSRAVRSAQAERDREIAERDLYLDEFEHRVKNNFMVVASLLDLQRRRSSDPATVHALTEALGRIDSIARAHRHLYRGARHDRVDMAVYLTELCAALADSLFLRGSIQLQCNSASAPMARDRAVPIGLMINELVTNAAKHAFAGRDAGTIRVGFHDQPGGWRLTVADDGTGIVDLERPPDQDGGLGRRLIDAFARQAGGTLQTETGPQGTSVTVDITD